MEKMLNTIMEKLESMSEEISAIRKDVATMKAEQTEFRVETRVNFNSLNDKIEITNEEVHALVESYGEITQRVRVLNNRYTKDKNRSKDSL